MTKKLFTFLALLIFKTIAGQSIETEKYTLTLVNQKQIIRTTYALGDVPIIVGKAKVFIKESKKTRRYTFEAYLDYNKDIAGFKFYCKKDNIHCPMVYYKKNSEMLWYRYCDVTDHLYKNHEEKAINTENNGYLILSGLLFYLSFPY